ncbi:hypothetical protein BDQ17DRAFT_1333445 [Cyathus striatus]|nr:hypothetical protein BDQ17DRAFT_1333445 [Cyathus striatus]
MSKLINKEVLVQSLAGKKTGISMEKSQCPNLAKFQLKQALHLETTHHVPITQFNFLAKPRISKKKKIQFEQSKEEAEVSDSSDEEQVSGTVKNGQTKNGQTNNRQIRSHASNGIEVPNSIEETLPPRTSRRRKFEVIDEEDEMICADPECCDFTYHLTCRGLVEIPTDNWFCDDECKKNAGYQEGGEGWGGGVQLKHKI